MTQASRFLVSLAALLVSLGCSTGEGDPAPEAAGHERVAAAAPDTAFYAAVRRANEMADAIEDTLRPVPLMRPADEAALRRYSNAQNLERARRLGARVGDDSQLERLLADGRLVRLEDSTEYWVVRDLGASRPFVTPDTRVLLERIGERFQERLADMGLPAYRFEVSSVLRTAEGQAALRQRNTNAAAGTSAHEFGTTVDIPYEGYAAPAELPRELGIDRVPGALGPAADAVARLALERVAARKSRELQAIMGQVLREAQDNGDVLVTLERLQPVYHITVARELAGS